jgi:succinyl-diaminopimelate desuccinylase
MADSTLALAEALIRLPSVTPNDAGCQDLLNERLTRAGFRIERMDRAGVSNTWARFGDAAPLLCFAGHTDVVPAGPASAWHSDPFQPQRRDGYLYGRGAADMKTSLAAFVTAIEAFLARRPDPPGSIAVLWTSDEEGVATDGTVAVVEALAARGEQIDYCVVGEPTSEQRVGDVIKNGRRGSLHADIRIRGTQGHVAYPHLAANPIHLAAPALAELAATRWDEGDAYFPPTTWQVSNIHAGAGATNVIPGELSLLSNFRFSPASPAARLRERLAEVLGRHQLDYDISWSLSGDPFFTPPGRLVDAVSSAARAAAAITPRLSTSGGTSDGRFIARICRQIIELGPVNASIHKVNERVALSAIDELHHMYVGVLDELFGAG